MALCCRDFTTISIKPLPPPLIHLPKRFTTAIKFSSSSDSYRVSLQSETLELLEWSSICNHLSAFTSTSMARSLARAAQIPIGETPAVSQMLLDLTKAATRVSLDFSGIEDVSDIVTRAGLSEVLSVGELCALGRTLRGAKGLLEQLENVPLEKCSPLLEPLQNCEYQTELVQKLGFCIDCNLSIILDRASEDLEIIRSERKRNMENLESLLKRVSTMIFQSGGINSPLITTRRSRMCVGIRASHRHLLPGGVVLDFSSSGATCFMEPKEAVELNNMEVKLANAEKAEERAILSMFSSQIAEAELDIKFLLDRVLELDLAFARAAYARWMNGVCPLLSNGEGSASFVHIEGIKHPLLLEPSLRSLSEVHASGSSIHSNVGDYDLESDESSNDAIEFPIPIDIKVQHGTKVIVISGPNTGGKTASMKTLGLAALMSKAGMYLPAKNNPKVPWFDLILADIGDQQSLEESLSTFSGHISRICKILEVSSNNSLVLIDEIGSGTDPSEGVALSASILQYLKERVGLAVITTHYADLSRLKEKDTRFENAAMEFSLETLKPTYKILWGSTGDSNALSIAKSIGFDEKVIERANSWVRRLVPEKQQDWKNSLYQSLMEEKNRLEARAKSAASLHSDIMGLYHEIQEEADDLSRRKSALETKEVQRVQQELKAANSQMEAVIKEFDNQLISASPEQFNSIIKKSESAIASIVEEHRPSDSYLENKMKSSSYTPQLGEQVLVTGLGDKLATAVEAPSDDDSVLVQYGKIRVRVSKTNIRALPRSKGNVSTTSASRLTRQNQQSRMLRTEPEVNRAETTYIPAVQTAKNSVDLRGMRVEEASQHLEMAIASRESGSVLFVIHGMGTGALKECALELLKNHPRVDKFEQESPMNYGCTVAYIK